MLQENEANKARQRENLKKE